MLDSNTVNRNAVNTPRTDEIDEFLNAHGWGEAARTKVPGDASSRRYVKLALTSEKEDKHAILMDAPFIVQDEQPTSYDTIAKLSASSPHAFLCISAELKRRGFSAPKIYGTDTDAGLLLLEDLGDDLFARVLETAPKQEAEMYSAAISVLAAIYRSSITTNLRHQNLNWRVRPYDNAALQAEADLFLNWYVLDFDGPVDNAGKAQWYTLWNKCFGALGAHAHGLALRDFHAENVFWMPERTAIANVGLIDFQDALFAHPSYDLVSLLEDARRDVDPDIVAPLIAQFCAEAGIKQDDSFHAAYSVQGAQRNAKILGIFVRLARRDGKQRYLDLIPRVAAHFRNDLSHPAMAELKAWTEKYAPSIWSAHV